jgi:hypothetical protein
MYLPVWREEVADCRWRMIEIGAVVHAVLLEVELGVAQRRERCRVETSVRVEVLDDNST